MSEELKKPYAVIKFNPITGMLQEPVIILKTRTGRFIKRLHPHNLQFSFVGKGLDEISFDIYKEENGKNWSENDWEKLVDLCIIDYSGYGLFQADVTVNDSDETIKSIVAQSLECELGQRKLREFHVNDEIEITTLDTNEKFVPTVLCNKYDVEHSLLHRAIKDKAPQWSIGYVSPLFNINGHVYSPDTLQREFTVDGTSIYDFFDGDVSREFGCIFTYDTYNRKINCYNLEPCVYKISTAEVIYGWYYKDGVYYDENNNIVNNTQGYSHCDGIGEDTNIVVSKSKLSNSFSVNSDSGSIKNCFYVTGGDDVINSAIAAANVTGNNYIYEFANFQYDDMGSPLTDAIKTYQTFLKENSEAFYKEGGVYVYDSNYKYNPNTNAVTYKDETGFERIITTGYILNSTKTKVYILDSNAYYENGKAYTKDDVLINDYIYNEPGLFIKYCQLIERINYLQHTKFPTLITPTVENAEEVANKIKDYFKEKNVFINLIWSETAFTHVEATIETLVGIVCDSRYKCTLLKDKDHPRKCTITDDEIPTGTWTGTFQIIRESNEKDNCELNLTINLIKAKDEDDENYMRQKLDIAISKMDIAQLDFSQFDVTTENGKTELKDLLESYNLNSVEAFITGFSDCVNTLADLKNNLSMVSSVCDDEAELFHIREEIAQDVYNHKIAIIESLDCEKALLESQIDLFRDNVDMHNFFNKYAVDNKLDVTGTQLWNWFQSYVREDDYNNGNYVSDGLDDAGLIQKAKDLLDVAKKELSSACVIQKQITGNLNNIFSFDELKTLHPKFALFNYIRAIVDDAVYKLRLTEIRFSDSSPETLDTTFSDTIETIDGKISTQQKILEQSASIATSYSSTIKQATQGAVALNTFDKLRQEGLDSSLYLLKNSNSEEVTMGNSGIWCKTMLDEGIYSDNQLRIISNGMYITNNGFKTINTAIGRFKYNNEWVYGINAEYILGRFLIGESLQIADKSGSVKIDGDGIHLDGGKIDWVTKIDASDVSNNGNTLDKIIGDYDDSIKGITDSISELDDRVQTYSQPNDPSTSWKSEEYESHVSDIWFDIENSLTKIWTKDGNSYKWVVTEDANLKALATQKSTIYRTTTAPNKTTYPELKSGDLWVLPADTVVGDKTYKKDTILIYNGSSWTTTTTDSAEDALSQLSDISKDGLLTPTEKVQLQYTITDIKSEYLSVCAEAKEYSVSHTDFDTAYNNLISYITPLLSDISKTDEIVSSTFDGYFNEYYLKRNALTETINSKIGEKLSKALSDAKQGIDDAAKALTDAKNYADGLGSNYDKAGSADGVKTYVDGSFKTSIENAYQNYSNTAVSNFDKAVAEYLQVPGATTIIGGNHVISPYIEGGYLNITNGNKQVIIDPSNQTKTDYIFAVKNGDTFSIGLKSTGDAEFNGKITAKELTISDPSKVSGMKIVKETKYEYAKTTTSIQPTSGWSTNYPTSVTNGDYIWIKTTISYIGTAYSDDISYSYSYIGTNGTNGNDGVSVTSVTIKYGLSTSSSTAPSSWYDTVPTVTSLSQYVWRKTTVNYSDSTSSSTTVYDAELTNQTRPALATDVTSSGVKIHPVNNTLDYLNLTSNNMDIASGGYVKAHFGTDGIWLGGNATSNASSTNYAFKVDSSGNGYFSGDLTATSGSIASFTIAKNHLSSGIDSLPSSTPYTSNGVYVGQSGIVTARKNGDYVYIKNGNIYLSANDNTETSGIIFGLSNHENEMFSLRCDNNFFGYEDKIYTPTLCITSPYTSDGSSSSASGYDSCIYTNSTLFFISNNLSVNGKSAFCKGVTINHESGTGDTIGTSTLTLGNDYGKPSSHNSRGRIHIYGVSTAAGNSNHFARLQAGENMSSDLTFTFPTSAGGTLATSSSDIRLKDNISDSTINAIEFIKKIKMRQFDWKDIPNNGSLVNTHQDIGFIADELEKLDSRLANGGGWYSTDEEDSEMNIKSVDMFYLLGYVVKALQEVIEKIDA